jgi:hypothetical protein
MIPELERRRLEIESVHLTEEEIKIALYSAKVRKYNEEKHREYWMRLEKGTTKTTKIL